MNELDRGGQRVRASIGTAAGMRRGQCDHRAQSLAASGDDITRQVRDHVHRAFCPRDEKGFSRCKIIGQHGLHAFDNLDRLGRLRRVGLRSHA